MTPNDPTCAPAALLGAISEAVSVLCVGHERPDGDAVGSLIALGAGLERLGATVTTALPEPVPDKLAFLCGAEAITTQPKGSWDLALVLDCVHQQRTGPLATAVERAERIAVLDHHLYQGSPGPLDWRDSHAAATAVIVWRLLEQLSIPVTPRIAAAIYTGVATDTGFFQYTNTSAEALAICASCAAAGVVPREIARQTAQAQPAAHQRLLGAALTNMELHCGGRLALSWLCLGDIRRAGATAQDAEDVINALRDTSGVRLSVLLKADGPGRWRVSLRSEVVDVAALARQFDGGGHAAAAGCTVEAPLGQARQRLLAAARRALESAEGAP